MAVKISRKPKLSDHLEYTQPEYQTFTKCFLDFFDAILFWKQISELAFILAKDSIAFYVFINGDLFIHIIISQ